MDELTNEFLTDLGNVGLSLLWIGGIIAILVGAVIILDKFLS